MWKIWKRRTGEEETLSTEIEEDIAEHDDTKIEVTPEPQPEPQQQSSGGGSGVTVPDHNETGANLVWVPTKGGTKYQSKSSCSGMEEPMQVSVETATANGYTPCKRCHW